MRRDADIWIQAKYHGEGSRNHPIVELEYKEMVEDISVTGSDKRWWDYSELFNSREARYRTMLVLSMGFFGQWSGNGPVSVRIYHLIPLCSVASSQKMLATTGARRKRNLKHLQY